MAWHENGSILVLENCAEKGETEKTVICLPYRSRLGDVYVNDAFSESHRKYVSSVAPEIPAVVTRALLFEKEMKELAFSSTANGPFFYNGRRKFPPNSPLIKKKYLKIADNVFCRRGRPEFLFQSAGI